MSDLENKNKTTDTAGGENIDDKTKQPEGSEKLTFSKEELEKKLQAEADRRVNQAKSKWEKDFEEKIKAERREAERLAKLSEEERERELDEKYKKELSNRERELLKKEMKLEAVNILNEKKLPVSFSDMVIGETAEDTQTRIKEFEKSFRAEVEKEVNSRLKGSTPQGGNKTNNKAFDMNSLIRGQIRRR